MKANLDTEITIRNQKVDAPDYLEIIHDSFVSDDSDETETATTEKVK